MIDFKSLEIEDKERIDALLKGNRNYCCEYDFNVLFFWGESYGMKCADVCGCFTAMSEWNDTCYYLFPEGERRDEALKEIEKDCAARGKTLGFYCMPEEYKNYLEDNFPGRFSIRDERDSYDYIYSVDKLADLKGKKYHGKRNHINNFLKEHPDYSFEELNEDNFDACLNLEKIWRENHGGDEADRTEDGENEGLQAAFKYYKELKLEGGLIRADGELVAFTVGGRRGDSDCFETYFEKAIADVEGSYAIINQEFAKLIRAKYPDVKYVNREDDLGLEGLRKAKLSYIPEILFKKYSAVEVSGWVSAEPEEKKEDISAEPEAVANEEHKPAAGVSPALGEAGLNFRSACDSDLKNIKALWLEAFPEDSEEFVDLLTGSLGKPENFVILEDKGGKLISMACLIPCELIRQGEPYPIYYLYGMCTAKNERGKGRGLLLLGGAKDYAESNKKAGIALVPADDGLFGFYEKAGYIPFFTKLYKPLNPGRPVFDEYDYGMLREALLKGTNHIRYGKDFISFLYRMKELYGEDPLETEFGKKSGVEGMYLDISTQLTRGEKGYLGIPLD